MAGRRKDSSAMPDKPTDDKPTDDTPADKPEDTPTDDTPEGDEETLGDAGKAALDAERKARRKAEREAKEAQRKLQEKEDAELSEKERAEKRAEKAEERSQAATGKLRQANLLTKLADDYKLTGAKAKAAVRLLDGSVEFDDEDDEPTNLKDAVKAAKVEYGEDAFKAATASDNGGADQGARQGASPDKPEGLRGAIAQRLTPNQ